MLCPSCQAENDAAAQVCFSCRSVLSAVTRGTLIDGRYEILSPLGKGGMGAVYKARDRSLDEVVALKLLRADVAGTPQMAERFRSEIKLARRVSHWNVCRIHEYGEDGARQYISMELVEGTSLRALLDRGPLPAGQAFDVALQAAEGLQAIHKVGIVHRDLKPLNIMVDPSGVVRVMDFGIAKHVGPGADAQASGYVMGTPEYMSPEQARGRAVDARSDVYALGVVLYEIFAGRVPFRADTPVATLLLHLEGKPPLEGPEAAAIPPALLPLLRQALAKSPAERFATAGELAAALRAARDETLGPAAAAGERAPTRVLPRPRRNAWAGGLLAAVLVSLGVGVVLQRGRVPDPVPSAPPTTAAVRPAASLPPATAPPATEAAAPETMPTAAPRPRSTLAVEPAVAQPVSSLSSAVPEPAASTLPSLASPPEPPPAATPTPAPSEPPASLPPGTSPPARPGSLLVIVDPWAEVSIDGRPMGQTPLGRIALPAGRHDVLLTNPRYEPVPRKVTIREGETLRLVVDLETDAVPRRR